MFVCEGLFWLFKTDVVRFSLLDILVWISVECMLSTSKCKFMYFSLFLTQIWHNYLLLVPVVVTCYSDWIYLQLQTETFSLLWCFLPGHFVTLKKKREMKLEKLPRLMMSSLYFLITSGNPLTDKPYYLFLLISKECLHYLKLSKHVTN